MPNIRLSAARRALAVALALAASVPAAADPPAARAAAEAAKRTFRDWRLDCAATACAARTTLRGTGGTVVLTVAAEGRGDAARLVMRTSLPLFLPDGLALGLGDAASRAVAWRTCDGGGCEATAPLGPDLLAALKREAAADVTLTLVDGVRVRLRASLLGFTAAWEAMEAAQPVSRP